MNLDEAVKHFNSKGLFAKRQPDSPGHPRRIIVAGQVEIINSMTVLNDVTCIYPENRFWIVEVRDGVPVPILGDFQVAVASVEEAVNIVDSRYFGKPEVINDWAIPIHRHPDWNTRKIHKTIFGAKRVTNAEWQEIRADLDRQLHLLIAKDLMIWFDHPELVYWMVASKEDKGLDLWMSRDLQQAYIVQNF